MNNTIEVRHYLAPPTDLMLLQRRAIRKVCAKRARVLRRRGERVEFSEDLCALVWCPGRVMGRRAERYFRLGMEIRRQMQREIEQGISRVLGGEP